MNGSCSSSRLAISPASVAPYDSRTRFGWGFWWSSPVLLSLSLVLGGLGWLGWKRIQSQFKVCGDCGTTNLGSATVCVACGASLEIGAQSSANCSFDADATPASSATIDITAEDVDS